MTETPSTPQKQSFARHRLYGLAVDPIHVGTGGARLGRVDNTIVRDPVTRVPKIPGSSLAGVYRAYVSMQTGRYPRCAGQGQADASDPGGHCGNANCEVCMCFGFARGSDGGFAGLAAFSDAHVVLFPVPTRMGPRWIASPSSLGMEDAADIQADKAYVAPGQAGKPLNLGWLLLETVALPGPVNEKRGGLAPAARAIASTAREAPESVEKKLGDLTEVPQHVRDNIVVVSDKLFGHLVNSNLEVRTSVSIDPATGAAEEGALFTYEAIPRGTVIAWDVTCRNPRHFKVGKDEVSAVTTMDAVLEEVKKAHELLKHLGIGGMGTRGMGRLRVLSASDASPTIKGGA